MMTYEEAKFYGACLAFSVLLVMLVSQILKDWRFR